MKRFGRISELFKAIWRDSTTNKEVTLIPNDTASYVNDTTIKLPPSAAASQVLVEETAIQTLEGKSIDATTNNISNLDVTNLANGVLDVDLSSTSGSDDTIPSAKATKTYVDAKVAEHDEASEISFDPSSSSLTTTDVQGAIDETVGRLDQAEIDIGQNAGNLTIHINDPTGAHEASAVSYDHTTSGLSATDVQGAVDEVEGRLDSAESSLGVVTGTLTGHINETIDAHAASAVSYNNSASGMPESDVQGVIDEIINRQANKQDASSELTGLSGLNGTGLIARTGAGSYTERELQGTSDEVTISNGDGTSGNPTVGLANDAKLPGTGAITVPKGTTAQRPSGVDGMLRYSETDGRFEGHASGAWGPIGGSGDGIGGINYIKGDSSNAETSIGDWTLVNSGVGLDWKRSTTSPLRGKGNHELWKKYGVATGSYAKCPFVVDRADRNKVLGVKFDVANEFTQYYEAGDFVVSIYDVDTSTSIPINMPSGVDVLKTGMYQFRGAFTPVNSNSANYELRFTYVGTGQESYYISLDNFEVGPGNVQMGFDGIWKEYDENDVNITDEGTALSDYAARLIPYKTSNGKWRLRFNIKVTFDATTSNDVLEIDGVTFLTDAIDFRQSVTAHTVGQAFNQGAFGYAIDNTGMILITGDRSDTRWTLSGDVALNEKPTWATFDPIATVYPTSDDLAFTTTEAFTPTGSWTTNTTYTGTKSKVFDKLKMSVRMTFSGAPNSATFTLTLPDSLTAYTDGVNKPVGWAILYDSDTVSNTKIAEVYCTNGSTSLNFTVSNSASPTLNQTLPFTWASGDVMDVDVFVPITQWQNSANAIPPIGLEKAGVDTYGVVKAQGGTYTPTLTAVANIGGLSATKHQYTYVDGVVTVTGSLFATSVTDNTLQEVKLTLPIPTNFSTIYDLNGTATIRRSTTYTSSGAVEASVSDNKALVRVFSNSGSSASHIYFYTFSYELL